MNTKSHGEHLRSPRRDAVAGMAAGLTMRPCYLDEGGVHGLYLELKSQSPQSF